MAAPPALKLRWSPYIPRQPYPSLAREDPPALTPKQFAFLTLDHREAFYGGAAGGAKSDALLMAALQYVDVPGYAALVLRGSFAKLMLPDAILDRAKQWLLPQGIPWNDDSKRFTFPSNATLTFGYLDKVDDRFRYQGPAFQFIGWDELTDFRESDYRWMFSRQRKLAEVDIPLRTRSTANPDGPGFEWVRQRFIVEGRDRGIPFIPSTLEDNPYIDRETYIESLNYLDSITRKRLLHGDWEVRPSGGVFMSWPRYRVDELPALRAIDIPMDSALGGDDYHAATAWGYDGSRVYWLDAMHFRGEQPEAARRIQYFFVKMRSQYPNVPVKGLHRTKVHLDAALAQQVRLGPPSTSYDADGTVRGGNMGMPVGPADLPPLKGASEDKRLTWGRMASVPFEGGQALLPDIDPGMLAPWMEEHVAFPQKGVHDDFVETTIIEMHHRFERVPFNRPKGPIDFWGDL